MYNFSRVIPSHSAARVQTGLDEYWKLKPFHYQVSDTSEWEPLWEPVININMREPLKSGQSRCEIKSYNYLQQYS